MKKWHRVKKRKRIMGVCAGLADNIGIDVSYIRLAWLTMTLVPPFYHLLLISLYVALAVILPEEKDYIDV